MLRVGEANAWPKSREIILAEPFLPSVRPGVLRPGGARQGVCRRSHREEVHDHRLVVAACIVWDEAAIGRPSQGERRRVRCNPIPIDSLVQGVGIRSYADFGGRGTIEVLSAEKRTGQEKTGVDRRELDVREPKPGVRVEEVVEEAFVAGDAAIAWSLRQVIQVLERGQCTIGSLLA